MLSGAVLSGGLSTRMGAEKGLIALGGVPLIVRVVDSMASVADDIVVSVAPGKAALYAAVVGDRARVIEDGRADIGPLEGMVRAFEAARRRQVVFSPCDTPFIRPKLCELIAGRAIGKDGAVPVVGGYLEPLHGAYDRTICAEQFQRAIASGTRKVTEAVEKLDIVRVAEEELRAVDPDLASFANLNSPEAIEAAERKLRTASGHKVR